LGRSDEARRIAADVRERLEVRLRTLAARGDRAEVVLGYWDQVTLAEAILVLGDLEAAGDAYRLGFTRHPERPNDHEVTRDQALRILSLLDVTTAAAESFLGRLGLTRAEARKRFSNLGLSAWAAGRLGDETAP